MRLQGLNVTANGTGQGKIYDINGRAVAALLTAGDFQLNNVQLVGGVMGTGSDFRWVGELRAAAERSYGTTITGLILQDARAEMNDGVLTASSSQFTAGSLTSSGTRANGITASDLRLRSEDNVTTASVAKVKAGTIVASGAKVNGVTANNIDIASRGGVTSVVVKNVQVGQTAAAGAEIGSINIAGVRLSIRGGRIEGSTADINAGTVKLADGQVENVKLAKPVFVVEPSGRYRASADLSIGGGMLGQMDMGQASARLVATNSEIQLNDFNADIFNGTANGNARIAIARGGTSRIAATFDGRRNFRTLHRVCRRGCAACRTRRVDELIWLFPALISSKLPEHSQLILPLKTSEPTRTSAALRRSGSARESRLLRNRQVDLQTRPPSSKRPASFPFEGDSDLRSISIHLTRRSLQAVLISSGLLPEVEEQMRSYGIDWTAR